MLSAEYTVLVSATVSDAILLELYSAVSPKEVTPAPMWNEVRVPVSEKACSPTVVTESGRVTEDWPARLKAKSPMETSLPSSGR